MANLPVHSPPITALILLFPGFNTLDVNGPLEVLAQSRKNNDVAFKCVIAAEEEETTAAEGCIIKRHIPLTSASRNLHAYTVLVVPGGPQDAVVTQAAKQDTFMSLISQFSQLNSPHILLSICTGALFLGTLSIFDGLPCTTHHSALSKLASICNQVAIMSMSQPGSVMRARFVDAGTNGHGVRIVSSGGVSCGLDASLYVVELRAGRDVAEATAALMEYAWRREEGVLVVEE